jgi:hypothetical protein
VIPSRPGPPDWARIDRNLCECYGALTPAGIDELTMPEILVLLLPAKSKGPPGGRPMTDAELDEYIRRQKALTPRQRLDGMREERRHG